MSKSTQSSFISSAQNGPDGDGKDDLDSGDEADGKKIDTEEVILCPVFLFYKCMRTLEHSGAHVHCPTRQTNKTYDFSIF